MLREARAVLRAGGVRHHGRRVDGVVPEAVQAAAAGPTVGHN